jgi:hypothetical protein
MTTKMKSLRLFAATALFGANAGYAVELGKTNISFNGYVKIDALVSQYSDGTLGPQSIGRDFYIPSLTPVGGEDEGTQFDAHVRQSRFRFTADNELSNGEKIKGVLEFDLQVVPDGDERISNSRQLRIRHGFITYKKLTIGQTWTTFFDVKGLPDTLDFIGNTDGSIFVRQPLIKYKSGGFEIALENPETTITPFGGGARIVADDNSVPDLIGRYTYAPKWGHISVAAIARQLSLQNDQNGNSIDATDTGFGVTATSKIDLGQDDLRLTFFTGTGLGRYAALNAANAAVLTADNELETIDSTGFALAYRHIWNEQWRSSLVYSQFNADNDVDLTGISATEQTYSTRVNLIYSPSKELKFGLEYTFAQRTLENNLDGDLSRLQASAQYSF